MTVKPSKEFLERIKRYEQEVQSFAEDLERRSLPAPDIKLDASEGLSGWALVHAAADLGAFDGETSGDPRRRLRDRILLRKRRADGARDLYRTLYGGTQTRRR